MAVVAAARKVNRGSGRLLFWLEWCVLNTSTLHWAF
jgi:hypothetical protein